MGDTFRGCPFFYMKGGEAMTVKDIIERIRASTHDNDKLDYTDEQFINYINNGIRFVRRTILAIDTYLLCDTVTGVNELPTEEEEQPQENENVIIDDEATSSEEEAEPVDLAVIKMEKPFSSIESVRVNGRTLRPINPRLIDEPDREGEAHCYFAAGFNNIHLWPRPTGPKVEYTVTYVPDLVILTELEDEVPFNNDIIDFIVEYGVIRASLVNEFDMRQEAQIMGSIIAQMENLLHGINGRGVQTEGYWNDTTLRRCDYGRRYR